MVASLTAAVGVAALLPSIVAATPAVADGTNGADSPDGTGQQDTSLQAGPVPGLSTATSTTTRNAAGR